MRTPSVLNVRACSIRFATLSLMLVMACGDTNGGDDGLPAAAEDPDPLVVPTNSDDLLEWLVAEPYLDWPSESGIHRSTGPHFGDVQTWVTPALLDSLEAGNAEHPAGSATVKELYGSGSERRGWSVSVKLADLSQGGEQWYWYEWFNGSIVASGDGISVCTGCHSGGQDFVLTPIPLQ